MPPVPAASRAPIQSAIAASHGARSASVSGWPACILATLAAEWKSSPSANGQPEVATSAAATVDLPVPDTPMITAIRGGGDWAWHRSGACHRASLTALTIPSQAPRRLRGCSTPSPTACPPSSPACGAKAGCPRPTSTRPRARSASRCSRPTSRCRSCASSSPRSRNGPAGEEVSRALNPAQQVIKIVNEELVAILGGETRRLQFAKNPPTVIMLAGLQGSGKTTLAGKLGRWLRDQGHTPLLVACDLQRPNAVNQLQIVGRAGRRRGLRAAAGQRRRRSGRRSRATRSSSPGGPSTTWSSSTPPAGSASTPR